MRRFAAVLTAMLTWVFADSASCQESPAVDLQTTATTDQPSLPQEIPLREFLVLPRVGIYGAQVIHQDPIDAQIAAGQWEAPQAGDEVTSAVDGAPAVWEEATADSAGRLSGAATSGGYAFATVDSPEERIMLLDATHYASAFVNGQWHAGDRYGAGGPPLPIKLRQGANSLLFHVASPGFTARLVTPDEEIALSSEDLTLPDALTNGGSKLWAAAPVMNATERPLTGGELRVTIGDDTETTALPPVEPLSLVKVAFGLPEFGRGDEDVTVRVALYLPRADTGSMSPDPTAEIEMTLQRKAPTDTHTKTFVSRIDGSVQPYSVIRASGPADVVSTGLVVALHGLGTNHAEFARNFKPKDWAHVIVPQNRRPYGFDWEDWGAADAMEALANARKELVYNPRRTYLTGHGMGGHGAWMLAMRYPDKFAAVGPSAGWLNTAPPVAEDETRVAAMLRRGSASRLGSQAPRNLMNMGVYLLHGEQDERVSPAQSRYMRSRLGEFHKDFVYHERPGAGHWWGPEGVDWPDMMAFFRERRIPSHKDVRNINFTTANPGSGASSFWATIEQQEEPLVPAHVNLDHDAEKRTFSGRTENVARLSLDLKHLPRRETVTVRLDRSRTVVTRPGRAGKVWLAKNDDEQWELSSPPPRNEKTPRRDGLLKSVFSNRPVLVYGTKGTADENEWAQAKAQYDAQTFWRLGNGRLDVIADKAFKATAEPNRSVILYGNAQSNAAWPALLSTSPVQVRRGSVTVSAQSTARPEAGDDLAVLMVRPRLGSTRASVAVVGGTGIEGMRLTNRLRYFVSGVTYPDVMIMGPDALQKQDGDIRAAGYFGSDWSVTDGQIVWRDLAL